MSVVSNQLLQNALKLHQERRWQEAIELCEKVLQAEENHVNAWHLLGVFHHQLGEHDKAIVCIDRAIALRPRCADFYSNRGVALDALGRFEDAVKDYDQSLSLQPNAASVYTNRGGSLKSLGRYEEALADMLRGCVLDSRNPEQHYNKGLVLQAMGRLDEAITCYAHVRQLAPQHVEAHWNTGLCLLLQGRYAEAWPFHEWRWRKQGAQLSTTLNTTKPCWQGQWVNRLFLWSEQGVGDEVFFASMFEEAARAVGQVTVSVDERLLLLYSRSFKSIHFISKTTPLIPESYDAHLPIGSLGALFRRSADDFRQVKSPYIFADGSKVQKFRKWLKAQQDRLGCTSTLGISWRSDNPQTGKSRSLALAELAQNLTQNHPQAMLLSLQYGEVTEEISELKAKTGLCVVVCDEVNNYNQLDDFAALIAACDGVVSVQNSTVHLAGALGVPVWPLLMYVPDWRWQLRGSDNPWYPCAQPVRQKSLGDWRSVFTQLDSIKFA